MERMQASQEQYNPDDYIETASLGTEIAPHLLRKLRSITAQIDLATEIEDFQSIGVQSREILIELGNSIMIRIWQVIKSNHKLPILRKKPN